MYSKITDSIFYVGVNDADLDLFEGQYIVPNGISYNSYIIMDEKTAVMDTADARKGDVWLANVKEALGGKAPDYLVISHMEPDHSANIARLAAEYPDMQLVGSAQMFKLIEQFYGDDFASRRILKKEGDTLELGSHTLSFIAAPMVHWPEVMMSYEQSEKVLFSADAFGKFGTLDTDEEWDCEARRYYMNIVGKFGVQVQALLKKASALEIGTICPLHGPILTEDLGYYINKYNIWSSYEPEESGVCIVYASAHGNTKRAALKLEQMLNEAGVETESFDLSRDDFAEAVEVAFKFDRLVACSITYDMKIFPCMQSFLYRLSSKNFQKRKVGIIENGSWGPASGKIMRESFEAMKDIEILEPIVTLKSALNAGSEEKLAELAAALQEAAPKE